jgi:hypothetical protein
MGALPRVLAHPVFLHRLLALEPISASDPLSLTGMRGSQHARHTVKAPRCPASDLGALHPSGDDRIVRYFSDDGKRESAA